jgi:hypothetical protein
MSKIALTPDASGTGTFTIASPDSNTNRTLTLPDVSGEVFSQGNILGTVSESSGVPTGAIIERGSNANGEYVKFADGTMICVNPKITEVNGATAGNYTATWTLPASFTDASYIVSANYSADSATNAERIKQVTAQRQASRSTSAVDVYYALTSTVNGLNQLFASATGRWF